MKPTRLRWWGAVAVAACTVTSGCSSSTDSDTGASTGPTTGTAADPPVADTAAPSSASGGKFSVQLAEPLSIDPAMSGEVEGFQVTRLVFTPLVSLSPDLSLEPGVAEDWSVGTDGVTWTFELRPDAVFSNGRTITADDFVYSFARGADPDMASPSAYQGSPIVGWDEVNGAEASGAIADEMVSGVTAIDDTTLQIVTTEPFSLLPQLLTYPLFSPVPKESLATEELAAAFAEQPIGAGPYMLSEPWQHQTSITVVKNPQWFGEEGTADEIEFKIYADNVTAYRDFQAGALDLVRQVPTEEITNARSTHADRFILQPVASLLYIGLPTQRAPFDDPSLRRALSLSIDREAINDRVYGGTQTPADAMVPPGTPGALSASCADCTYDPELAKQLYAESGGLPDDTMVIYNISEDGTDALDAVINGWRDVLGIDVEMRSYPFAEYLDVTADPAAIEGPFELGWVWDYPSGHSILSPLFESTSTSNNLGYSNPEFDDAMADMRRATDDAEAFEALQRGQRIVEHDLPLIPLGFTTDVGVHSTRVSEVHDNLGSAWQLEDVVVAPA